MTLLEVLVTLVLLALMTSIATLGSRRPERERDGLRAMLDDSLAAAIAQGRRISIFVRVNGRSIAATVSPNGSVVGDSDFLSTTQHDPTHAR
jgi:Tfp pilus assembly protein FimT